MAGCQQQRSEYPEVLWLKGVDGPTCGSLHVFFTCGFGYVVLVDGSLPVVAFHLTSNITLWSGGCQKRMSHWEKEDPHVAGGCEQPGKSGASSPT